MPFDGVVTKSAVCELSQTLIGGRIEKIFQPESDEILLNIRAKSRSYRLLLSANANYPRVHLTDSAKENPAAPPVFCMLLRKHLSGGKISGILFHDFERIVTFDIDSISELGDPISRRLIIEVMSRYSNIILINETGKIIDSIKHVDSEISSVREVMPGSPYVPPPAQNKTSPADLDPGRFFQETMENAANINLPIDKYLLNQIRGFSPLLCREICYRAGIDPNVRPVYIPFEKWEHMKKILAEIFDTIDNSGFTPCIVYENEQDEKPLDFHCLKILQYKGIKYFGSISGVLDTYYSAKDRIERLKQKKSDLFKLINNCIDRCCRKKSIQEETLREVSDMEKLRLYGELITANIYSIQHNSKNVSLMNYYAGNNEYIEVPLDENLLPQENAQKYFKQYQKAKNTYNYAGRQLEETLKELEYLNSVAHMLDSGQTVREIEEIREELTEQGYLSQKKKHKQRKNQMPSPPVYYKSTEGFDIFAGRNNKQNDILTLRQASSNDIWLHTRNIPGSHVIIKKLQQEIPDNTLLQAAIIAAYHSNAKMSSNVPVDYTRVKNVKKPPGAKPGMVIYENFKTIIVTPDENMVNRLKSDKL